MNIPFSSIFFSVFFWIIGYIFRKIVDNGISTKQFICPKWLCVLYGISRNQKRIVSLRSAGYQTIGIILIFYTFFFRALLPLKQSVHDFIGLIISIILGAIIANVLYKRYRYDSNNNI